MSHNFSLLITTKNRLADLIFTLDKIYYLIERPDVECIVYDDGSADGTFKYIKEHFPKIKIIRNEISKGYIYCRNFMLNTTKARYAISLDDDAHFLSAHPLEAIEKHFKENSKCGLIAFRIFWGMQSPNTTYSSDQVQQVKSFVGCGHVWRMAAWRAIPNYPEWFVFYGEEEFASYQLFKNNWEINYVPSVLVNHRVNVKERKKNNDYQRRTRMSFRSGWYLYFLFYPLSVIPKKLVYTLWMQVKTKTFKGDFKATRGIVQAMFDVVLNFPKLLKHSNRLTMSEYQALLKLPPSLIYWKPEDEK